jgi:hypothetical protein
VNLSLLLACAQPSTRDDSAPPARDSLPWPQVETEVLPEGPVEIEDLFSDELIHTLELDISSSARSDLRSDPTEWVPVDLIVEGFAWPVGIRIKGTSTFQSIDDKPSLKIDFGYQVPSLRFQGLRRVNLHNIDLDPMMSSEVLNWGFFRAADLPAPRVGYTQLLINGDERGLYTIVEDIEDEFLERWFDDPDGNLYENAANYCDFTRVSCFDREEDDEGDDDALQALIEASDLTGDAWLAAMQAQMDWDRFTGFMAMERTIAHWDSYSFDLSNYRVYHDPTADDFAFIPWSGDLGFGYRPWSYVDCGKHGVVPGDYDMGKLASACEQVPACHDAVLDKMLDHAQMLEDMGAGDMVVEALERVRSAAEDERRDMGHFEEHGQCVEAWLRQRPDEIRGWVEDNR